MLTKSVMKTLRTATRGYFIKLMVISVIITAGCYAAFLYGVKALLAATSFVSWNWVEWLLDGVAGFGTAVLAFVLFPTILPLIANLFQEEIAGLIEKHEYKDNTLISKKLPLFPELMGGLSFAAWSLLLNIMIIPLFLLGPLYAVAYYGLNAHLLGREFFEIVASRYIGRKEAREVRKDSKLPIFLGGMLILLMINIPFVNLFAPFFAVALMVHYFQGISAE